MLLRARRTTVLLAVGLAAWFGGTARDARGLDGGIYNDFHVSFQEPFFRARDVAIDNYLLLDGYGILGAVDFHSEIRATNDLFLLGEETAQLTLAYLTAERLLGRWNIAAGRRFFAEGFDAYIGDGVSVEYLHGDRFRGTLYCGVPFDAEESALANAAALVYGARLGGVLPGWTAVPRFRLSARVERRENWDFPDLAQLLLGAHVLAELAWALDSDLFLDVEYEVEEARLRRIKAGTLLYLTHRLSCRLEAERFEPDRRRPLEQADSFFQDTITNLFARSAIVGGTIDVAYDLPGRRDARLGYSVHRYLRGRDRETFGHRVALGFTFLSVPRHGLRAECGYSGYLVSRDSVHLGSLRVQAAPRPWMTLRFTAESGVLNTADWNDRWLLHVRGSLGVFPVPNLETSVALEENHNPYVDSDFRVILFCRLLLGSRRVME